MRFKVPRFEVVTTLSQRRAVSNAYRRGANAIGESLDLLTTRLCEIFGYEYTVLTTNASLGLWLAFETSEHSHFSVPPVSTCNAVYAAIRNAGGSYTFRTTSSDSFLQTRNCEPTSPSTVKVPLFGRIEEVTGDPGLEIIEDASQAFLTRMALKSEADVLILSMFPTKFPGGIDGGAVLTSDSSRFERIRNLVGRSSLSTELTRNWTLSNLNAVAINAGLDNVKDTINHLQAQFLRLCEAASEAKLDFLPTRHGEVPTRFLFRARSTLEAESLFLELRRQGVEVSYELVDFEHKEKQVGGFEEINRATTWLSVPMYFGISARKHRIVVGAIKRSARR